MITEDYVSFETAKLLKEKGFDWMVTRSFFEHDNCYAPCDPSEVPRKDAISIPTLQMAMKWLREAHNIAIVITPSMFWGRYNAAIYKRNNVYPFGFDGDSLIPSYEEACESAIKYCLENLI